jgi:hypothetical protein
MTVISPSSISVKSDGLRLPAFVASQQVEVEAAPVVYREGIATGATL